MREIVEVIPMENFFLQVKFDDGVSEIVDMKPLMKREIFQALWNEDFFARVEVDQKFRGIFWPGEREVCIDWLEAEIGRRRPLAEFA